MLVTGDGTLWIGGHGGNLSRWRDGEWKATPPSQTPIPQVRMADMAMASDGAIWFAGLGQEAVRLEYATGCWTSYDDLLLFAESSDGQLWLSTHDHGLIHFDGKESICRPRPASIRRYLQGVDLPTEPPPLIPPRAPPQQEWDFAA